MSGIATRRSAPSALYLDSAQLAAFARLYADEVSAGDYPYVDFDPDERWHQRLYRDRRVDIWVIGWLPSQGTQLHDHGGSSGSFTVLDGTLTETVFTRGGLRDHRRGAGSQVGFGAHYVHDVRNLSDTPAVSVHAYSPPLTTMNFYDPIEGGGLTRLGTLATDDPEPDFTPAAARAS
jgi:predicted metal-dependent enzyme (double-stranded beta helix superfamily)